MPPTLARRPDAAAAAVRAQGLALALAGSVAFSGKAIIVKLAYRHGVDALTLVMYRMVFALPFFLALMWWAGRGRPRMDTRDRLAVWALPGLAFQSRVVMTRRSSMPWRVSQRMCASAPTTAIASGVPSRSDRRR